MTAVSDGKAIQPHPRELRERCFELFEQGKTFVDIAYETRVAAPTVRSWAMREKWRERVAVMKEQPETNFEAALVIVEQREREEDVPLELSEQQHAYEADMRTAAVRMARHVANLEASELVQKSDKIAKGDLVARKALKIEAERPNTIIQIGVLSQPQNALRHQTVADRRGDLSVTTA